MRKGVFRRVMLLLVFYLFSEGNIFGINKMDNIIPLHISTIGDIGVNFEPNKVTMNFSAFIILILAIVLVMLVFALLFRSKRQRHLLYEKNMMQSLIDNIPDIIYFKDLNSKFTRINKAEANLLGVASPEEAIGKSDFDYFEHAQEAYDIEQEIIKTGIPLINKTYKFKKGDELHYLSDTKIPLTDTTGKCIGTVGITRDVTDLKITEGVMLENQSKFKALFENAPLAIFRFDSEMRVVESNHRFRKMFGYSEEDDITKITKTDLLVDEEIGSLIFDTVVETKEANTEIMLKRKNGEHFIANLTLALLEEGFNEITIEGIVEDITQVAHARDEIIKAKDQAVEADRLKSLFLANMSHEIRTPMNAIIGFSNMLKEEGLSDEDRNSFIDVIQSNGNSLMTLIDSIVDFSKLESDQMVISIGEFNFKPLFDSVCDYTQNLLKTEGKTNIKVIRSYPENPDIRIKSDRHRLNQVLNHLVANAVKFTNDGEIEISYSQNDDHFKIFVRDTGIGINAKNHKIIFDRFTKVSDDKTQLYRGTGIGLTISKGLIELMKGTIYLESEEGKGSIFTIIM